jgi:hypothetical protein
MVTVTKDQKAGTSTTRMGKKGWHLPTLNAREMGGGGKQPVKRFELLTRSLRMSCSTPELHRRKISSRKNKSGCYRFICKLSQAKEWLNRFESQFSQNAKPCLGAQRRRATDQMGKLCR